MSIIIGIDHGYYAIKTAHCSFPTGLTSYGEHEPYTRQGLLEFGGCFFVCGSGRQPIQRDKTVNDNYYLLTLAAIAKEIQQRGLPPECSVRIAAGLPLTSFGRDKPKFRDYLLRSNQPVNYKFEGVEYSITIEEVAVFPQGYAALMTEVGLLQDEPSMLFMDLGGWTVDLMRIDNAIPAADTAHSLELGMIRCVDDVREQVRRETGLSLTDAQIENADDDAETVYIGTLYVPSNATLQRFVILDYTPVTLGGDNEIPELTPEGQPVDKPWSASYERTETLDFSYTINTDKIQLETLEKVDGAGIDIAPILDGIPSDISGGSWTITASRIPRRITPHLCAGTTAAGPKLRMRKTAATCCCPPKTAR